MPPPVLIFDLAALAGVVDDVPDDIYDLGGRFWPGALTIILHAYPSLSWDLGEPAVLLPCVFPMTSSP